MKQIKNIFLMFSLGTLLISCGRNSITNRDDYAGFLQPSTKNITDIDNDIVFWQNDLSRSPTIQELNQRLPVYSPSVFNTPGIFTNC